MYWLNLDHAMGNAPLLTRHQELDLAERAQAGDESAFTALVTSHLRIVLKVARSYRGSGLPFSDLAQEGIVGLIKAVRRFDPEAHGTRLSTYALWWIKAQIQDYVIRSWSLVKIGTTSEQKSLFLALRKKLKDGAPAVSDEFVATLAARFDATATEIRLLARRMMQPDQALDQPAYPDGPPLIDTLAAPTLTPEQIVVEKNETGFKRRLLNAALEKLSPRERLIVARRHLAEKTPSLESLAREMDLSKERVRVLEKRALARLKEMLAPVLAENGA